jgi:hypothetical protein
MPDLGKTTEAGRVKKRVRKTASKAKTSIKKKVNAVINKTIRKVNIIVDKEAKKMKAKAKKASPVRRKTVAPQKRKVAATKRKTIKMPKSLLAGVNIKHKFNIGDEVKELKGSKKGIVSRFKPFDNDKNRILYSISHNNGLFFKEEDELILVKRKAITKATKVAVSAKKFNDINKFIYYGWNFDHDFIEKVWNDDKKLDDWRINRHLREKFNHLMDKHGPYAGFFVFYSELSNENKQRLMTWVLKHYKG